MLQYAVKILVTVAIVVAVSEIGKRSTFWASLLASLPLTSMLAMIWLYAETKDVDRVAALSQGIVWLFLPSLLLLLALPFMLRSGMGFWTSILLGSAATVGAYAAMVRILTAFGVRL